MSRQRKATKCKLVSLCCVFVCLSLFVVFLHVFARFYQRIIARNIIIICPANKTNQEPNSRHSLQPLFASVLAFLSAQIRFCAIELTCQTLASRASRGSSFGVCCVKKIKNCLIVKRKNKLLSVAAMQNVAQLKQGKGKH